jgi:hypothetical protein
LVDFTQRSSQPSKINIVNCTGKKGKVCDIKPSTLEFLLEVDSGVAQNEPEKKKKSEQGPHLPQAQSSKRENEAEKRNPTETWTAMIGRRNCTKSSVGK